MSCKGSPGQDVMVRLVPRGLRKRPHLVILGNQAPCCHRSEVPVALCHLSALPHVSYIFIAFNGPFHTICLSHGCLLEETFSQGLCESMRLLRQFSFPE